MIIDDTQKGLSASARIVNPPAELYLDAVAFHQQVLTERNQFLRWRLSRASVLAAYSALEAAINVRGQVSDNDRVPLSRKWLNSRLIDCHITIDNQIWADFLELESTRVAMAHYTVSETKYKALYVDLEGNLHKYIQAMREMFSRIHGNDVIANWERNIVPKDSFGL